MVGRIHNKARKERETHEMTRGARENAHQYAIEMELRRVAFERVIDTPGCGYLRLRCLCGNETTLHGVDRGDVFRCNRCQEGRQSAIWPRM